MLIYYRLPGLLATFALLIYAALTFAIFKPLGAVTLTLAGIAGFILSVGMAVDANILIFERMKEELRAGRSLGAAIDAGFNRAWTSIFDSNVTTLDHLRDPVLVRRLRRQHHPGLRADAGARRAVSMFTAITVTRTMLRLVVGTGSPQAGASDAAPDRLSSPLRAGRRRGWPAALEGGSA